MGVQAVEEGREPGDGLIRCAAQGEPVLALLRLDIGAQRLLPGRRIPFKGLLPGQGGVHGAVQDDAPDVVGEELGVHGPQVGAVGVPEEVEVLVLHQGPHDIHVAGHRTGVHVVEDLGDLRVLLAGRGLARSLRNDVGGAARRQLGGRLGPPGHHRLNVVGGPAGDGGGLADAARVEADDVVVLQDPRQAAARVEPGLGIDEGDTASPGASGVEEDRAPRGGARRGQLLEGHRDGLALRVVVVQGHGHGGALEGGAGGAVGAVGPGEILTVEGLQPLGDRGPR